MLKELQINSILDGQSNTQYFSSENSYLTSIAIDPDMPIGSDTKASGCIVPVVYEEFSGANITGYPKWILTNIKNSLVYVYNSDGKVVSYTSALASETLVGTPTNGAGNGAVYYNNYLYFATPTDISRYGPLNGSPSLTNTVWTGATLGSLTDFPYTVTFNLCTFQSGDKGISLSSAKDIVFSNCHFEKLTRPFYENVGSSISVRSTNFGLCGQASLIPGFSAQASYFYIGGTSFATIDGCTELSIADNTIVYTSPTGYDYKSGNLLKDTKFTGNSFQVGIPVGGVLDIFKYPGRIYVNNSVNELNTLTGYFGVGDEIILECLGNLVIDASSGNIRGNISGVTKYTYKSGDQVQLKFTKDRWSILNSISTLLKQGTGTPEGVVFARIGAIFQRLDTGALYYKSTAETLNTGWNLFSTQVQNSMTASTTLAPSVSAVNTAISTADATNVKTTGAQNVAGVKTLSDNLVANGGVNAPFVALAGVNPLLRFNAPLSGSTLGTTTSMARVGGNVAIIGSGDTTKYAILFSNTLLSTSDRIYQFPDANGVMALTSDITNAVTGAISNTNTSASTLTLSVSSPLVSYYVFTGTTATWTLPVPAGNTTKKLSLINTGSGIVTVNTNAGANVFYNSGSTTNTYALLTGSNIELYSDGTRWIVL